MHPYRVIILTLALTAMVVILAVPRSFAESVYTYTRLRPPTGQSFQPTALSGDGLVIAGQYLGSAGYWRIGGTVQTIATSRFLNMEGIQPISGPPSLHQFHPTAIDADGSVIVGSVSANGTAESQGFRWDTQAGTGIVLDSTYVNATNADGSAIVGNRFLWTAASGVQTLPPLPGSLYGHAEGYGFSQDGSVLVGYSDDEGGTDRAVAWIGGSVHQLAPSTELGISFATAVTMTPAGAIIAGYDGHDGHAVRWTPSGMETLGSIFNAFPCGISEDGSVIVGNWSSGYKVLGYLGSGTGFIWTAELGMVNLTDLVHRPTRGGVGISADGNTIVGYDGGPWMIQITTVPEPSTLVILATALAFSIPPLLTRRQRTRFLD